MTKNISVPIRTYKTGKTHGGYTFREIDLSSLGDYVVSGYHFRYDCPWCLPDENPKNNRKLYYNYNTGIGFCFRCETVIVNKNHSRPREIDFNKFSWFNFLSQNTYKDISWTDTALVSDAVKIYLSKRKYPYENDIIQEFNLRYFIGVNLETVLLLPNNSPNRLNVDSFQTSVVAGHKSAKSPKYITYSDNKILYFLDKAKDPKTIILVEGIFDAISVFDSMRHKDLVVCPMLGKSMSRSQQKQFYYFLKKNKKPKEIIIALDGDVKDKEKIKLGRQMLSVDSSINIYYISLPDRLDPEEAVAFNVFDTSLSKARRIIV